MKTTVRVKNFELSFTDADVVEINEVEFAEDHSERFGEALWLLHDHGFTVCVVQAQNLQDALDSAVDANRMERYLVDESEASDYDCESLSYLGNACEPHDIESLGFVRLPLPKRSVTALFGDVLSLGDATECHF